MDQRRFEAFVALGRALREERYHFVTVTPETHRRVIQRRAPRARTLRDVFGWSLPFEEQTLPRALFDLLGEAGALHASDGAFRSAVRFSSLGERLFMHSAFPTVSPSAVFFGPDTYRFCAAVARGRREAKRVVDVGCGTGAGGLTAGESAQRVVLVDINDEALAFAGVNCALAGARDVEIARSDLLAGVDGPIDRVIANPPYLRDEPGRVYRDGGGRLGEALAQRIVLESLERLERGGSLLLYTGAAIVDGHDVFMEGARPILARAGATFHYEELDPDVFGEEIENEPYARVDRIAAVVLTATRPL